MDSLPPYVSATRQQALEAGAAYVEREIRILRAHAMSLDGHPYGEQYETKPIGGEAERLLLDVLHKAQCATILREMAQQAAAEIL
jgi:hypothetical protein